MRRGRARLFTEMDRLRREHAALTVASLAYFASVTGASAAFFPTDLMPLSIEALVLYISLFPIGSPFEALRTKNAEPSLAVLRSKRASLPAFFFTEAMPPSAPLRES